MITVFNASRPLVLVGCGTIGSLLLRGWLADGLRPDAVIVIDPGGRERAVAAGLSDAHVFDRPPEGLTAGLIFIAVKPQMLAAAIAPFTANAARETRVLSVVAGQTLKALRALLPNAAGIVRAMPNTPAAVGQAITVACAEKTAGSEAHALAQALLESVGQVRWVKDEALMDVVTALSGSGPAYVFYLIECLAAAAQAQGMPSDLAIDLALETVAGAGELARRSDLTPAELRHQVATPGGTTLAGLEILMSERGGLAELIRHTIAAAAKRSKELSNSA